MNEDEERMRIILINRRLGRITGTLMRLVALVGEIQSELRSAYAPIYDDEFNEERMDEWLKSYRKK
jgi:hypothetical protein